jgi:hypothetical protein
MDECAVTLPAGFRDRTMHILEWKTEEGDSVVLMVQRDDEPPRGGRTFEDYVAEQTREYPARFAGFKLERDEVATGETGGVEMIRKTFRSTKDGDVLYHHQAFVHIGPTLLVFTGAAKARHRDYVDRVLDEALRNPLPRGD